jgi:serine/threonine protein kinase
LGLIFHILLLGVSAFPGRTYNEVLAQNRASSITFDGDEYQRLDANTLDLLSKMLKKNPQERINAVDALNHPYFANLDEEDEEEKDKVVELVKSPEASTKGGSYPSCDSPLLTSSNPARKKEMMLKKDSCVEFKMGKENVFTGKVETVGDTGALTSNSVGKRFESVVMPKISKFSTKK